MQLDLKGAMGMRFTENRKLACVVLAVCVLLSIFAFGGGALARERGKVLKVFNEGTDTTLAARYSMDAYLDSAAEYAQIMASEASLHLGDSEVSENVAASAATLANDAAGLDARYSAYVALKSDVDKLYNAMKTGVSESDFTDFKLAYDDFWGQDDLLGRDDYPKYAKAYNGLISGFPGSLVAKLLGQGALSTFGG